MKAWEYIARLTEQAEPVVLDESQQTWTDNTEAELQSDAFLRLMWDSHVPGSGAPESITVAAVQSWEQLGYDVREAELYIESGLEALKANDMDALHCITARIYEALFASPKDAASQYWKYRVYDTFEQYAKSVKFPDARRLQLDSAEFSDRIAAGWRGRLIGGAFGTALEGYTTAQLYKKFGELTGYVRQPNTYNDDITYEIAFLRACQVHSGIVTSDLIADQWLKLVPSGWSAEQIALENLRRGIYPPQSGTFRNAFQEWIGAQMRGAICGQVAPGNAKLAAYLAFQDAQISHHGNGVLGEVFNAVLTSLAYIHDDIVSVLDGAISCIPEDSEYYQVLAFARNQCERHANWQQAWDVCERKYHRYNWIHSYPNAAAEVVALMYGKGDFDMTMRILGACGQDVDCNAAQIGVVLGTFGGTDSIGGQWWEPFTDEVVTYLRGKGKKLSLSMLLQDTVDVAKKLAVTNILSL